MAVTIDSIDHLVINVSDVERSAAWFQKVLGVTREDFDPGHGKPKRTSIKFGQQKINLRPVTADGVEWFTGLKPMAGSDDLCFLTTSSPQQIIEHLGSCGLAVEEGPVRKQGARGPLQSVYCRDPDGNLIEISSYV